LYIAHTSDRIRYTPLPALQISTGARSDSSWVSKRARNALNSQLPGLFYHQNTILVAGIFQDDRARQIQKLLVEFFKQSTHRSRVDLSMISNGGDFFRDGIQSA
jgi:hypothetical protein